MTHLETVPYIAGRDRACSVDAGPPDAKLLSAGTPVINANRETTHLPTAKLVLPRRKMIECAVASAHLARLQKLVHYWGTGVKPRDFVFTEYPKR